MSEMAVVQDMVNKTLRATEYFVKKAWSVLDAVSEKRRPGDVMSQQAICTMQQGISSSLQER